MSQPANDEFSQHLSDDEESNHEDASDTGAAPKQKQQVIPQTTTISNIKSNSKKEVMENSKRRGISAGEGGIVRLLSPINAAEIQADENGKERAKNFCDGHSQRTYREDFMEMSDGFSGASEYIALLLHLHQNPEKESFAGFADEINDVDNEENGHQLQIAMIAIRMKKVL
ncbi:hypothetical protein Tco_0600430 [Tanacetum coccineum]|uniref:Uncharacterized protein n=1 Tax=Tanacetum coccineum TaxID=301880 RepID=A0ABQ4WBV5_9ASTR